MDGAALGRVAGARIVEPDAAAEGVDPQELGDRAGLVEVVQVVGDERQALGIAGIGEELALGDVAAVFVALGGAAERDGAQGSRLARGMSRATAS